MSHDCDAAQASFGNEDGQGAAAATDSEEEKDGGQEGGKMKPDYMIYLSGPNTIGRVVPLGRYTPELSQDVGLHVDSDSGRRSKHSYIRRSFLKFSLWIGRLLRSETTANSALTKNSQG